MFGGYINPSIHPALDGGSVTSGDLGDAVVFSGNIASGQVGWPHLSLSAVQSGQIGSGAVTGQAGGGFFVVASGTLGTNNYGSGSVVSGIIASGQIGFRHVANAAIQSGSIASGQVAWPHLTSGTIYGVSGIIVTVTTSGIQISQSVL